MLGTNLFFGMNYISMKYFTLHHLAGPFALNLIRVTISATLFWSLFLFKYPKSKIGWKDLWLIAGCALAAIGVNQMLFLKGLSYTSPIHASLLTLITPILISLFAAALLNEKFKALNWVGLCLALTGAGLLLSGKEGFEGDLVFLGDLLIIGSAIAYTLYFIIVKPLMNTYSPTMVTRMLFTFGFLFILPISYPEYKEIPWGAFHLKEWMILFFIVIPGTFLAYLFNLYGIQKLSASVAGTYIYTQPVFAGIASGIVFGEDITLLKLGASLLIFAGLYLSGKASGQKSASG